MLILICDEQLAESVGAMGPLIEFASQNNYGPLRTYSVTHLCE